MGSPVEKLSMEIELALDPASWKDPRDWESFMWASSELEPSSCSPKSVIMDLLLGEVGGDEMATSEGIEGSLADTKKTLLYWDKAWSAVEEASDSSSMWTEAPSPPGTSLLCTLGYNEVECSQREM